MAYEEEDTCMKKKDLDRLNEVRKKIVTIISYMRIQ